jgi:hypothetical protein
MKKSIKTMKIIIAIFAIAMTTNLFAQRGNIDNFRSYDKDGLNVFETPKQSNVPFDGIKVRVGGDFALQFQGLSNVGDSTIELANNFNLPTANLNLDVQLADGMRMHLRTYLSSQHHTEAYVKGGYLQMDKLDFVKPGFLSDVMEVTTIRVGMDQYNYGDAQFRRSDNANAIYNPFVGNYLMDAFTTEPFAEITVQKSGFIGVLGLTNGRLNQKPTPGDNGFAFFGKLGYDSQVSEDLRVRFTGSIYSSSDKGTRDYMYGGDRAGSRYYETITGGNDFGGRFNPGFSRAGEKGGGYLTAFQLNPFIKFQGLELFGIFEMASNDEVGGAFTQLGAELLYRFGANEDFYIGGRYNSVSGEESENAETKKVSRFNIGGGWFLTKNVLTKIEYVNQTYGDAGWNADFIDAGFKGIMIEAVVGF